ncbi:transposase [Burkholderia pseudomallei]|nr:transposase [Burkholderia pseudomallei]CAK0149591.1 transposase [Burkholderia pseudomallei]
MLKTPMPTQHELEMVTLEELVPKDHLLRQIDAAVDFEFIRAKVAHLYCADNGRPALDPVVQAVVHRLPVRGAQRAATDA